MAIKADWSIKKTINHPFTASSAANLKTLYLMVGGKNFCYVHAKEMHSWSYSRLKWSFHVSSTVLDVEDIMEVQVQWQITSCFMTFFNSCRLKNWIYLNKKRLWAWVWSVSPCSRLRGHMTSVWQKDHWVQCDDRRNDEWLEKQQYHNFSLRANEVLIDASDH